MTQKEIKEIIKNDEERLLEAQEGYKHNLEYKKIQEELDEILKKKAQLENRKYQIQIDYRKEAEDDIKFAREELAYSKELLRKAQQGLDPKDYNDELIAMFKAFYSGSTYNNWKKLQWVSEDGCYAVFKVDSHSEYTDRMSGVVYGGAEWYLFRIDPNFTGRTLECSGELCLWKREGGRWGEKRDVAIIEEVIYNYENNDYMSQQMEALGFKLEISSRWRPKWVNENIVIKYTTERTHTIGLDKGKTIVTEHERFCELTVDYEYYLDMPTNYSEFEKKYSHLIKEINENK